MTGFTLPAEKDIDSEYVSGVEVYNALHGLSAVRCNDK